MHLAGVNRGAPDDLEEGNLCLAERLVAMLEKAGGSPKLVYANSVQADTPSPYGRGKAGAARVFRRWAQYVGAPYVDVLLPNLYGECGRPDYHSFVATFCHRLATGGEPRVNVDRQLALLHAQDAAALIVERPAPEAAVGTVRPPGTLASVSDILARLVSIASTYSRGRFPDLSDPLTLRLFNTYRSYLHPQGFPIPLTAHRDHRGSFVETTQAIGGGGQSSFSTTEPGVTRGNHFHRRRSSGSWSCGARPVSTYAPLGWTDRFLPGIWRTADHR